MTDTFDGYKTGLHHAVLQLRRSHRVGKAMTDAFDGYTTEDDVEMLAEYNSFGVCSDCGCADTGYCACGVFEGDALVRIRRQNQEMLQAVVRRVRQRKARKHLRMFRVKVNVMLLANYWYLLPLLPGARAIERASKRFCAAVASARLPF